MKKFEGKTIVITGAAVGLGYATAENLASQGANLSLIDYNEKTLKEAKQKLLQNFSGIKVLAIVADVSDEEAVKNYVDQTVKEFGTIDGFYNNAGIEGKQTPMVEYDTNVFKKVIDINLLGVFYGMKYIIPVMIKNGGGKIVNVSSVGGLRGVLNQAAYVATKHAVAGLTKQAALEYGSNGILTNAIAPGAIMTPMVEEAFRQVNPDNPEAAEKEYASRNPVKRLGTPAEVASVVSFLLSDDNGYLNGQVIAIDGGEANFYGNEKK